MVKVFSVKMRLLLKMVCAVAIVCIVMGFYPLHIIPIARISNLPDSTFEWEHIETVTISEFYNVRQEYHPLRTMRFDAISLVIDSISEDIDSKLSVSVYDAEDNIMGHSETALSNLVCRKKQIIPIKTSKIDADSTYYIAVKIDGDASADLYFVDKNAEKYFGTTFVTGEPVNTSVLAGVYSTEYTTRDVGIYMWLIGFLVIVFLVVPWKKIGYVYLRIVVILDVSVLFLFMSYYQKVYQFVKGISELKKLYLCFVLIAMIILLFHAYINAKNLARKEEKCFLVSIIGWGIIYLLLMPPYSYPDEPTHYAQANAYVNQFTGREIHDENGQIYIRKEELIDVVSFPSSNSLVNYYDGCFVNSAKQGYGTMGIVNGRGLESASIFCYIPFEIGIIIARVLNLNYVWSFTLSNIFGLIFYTAIVYIAIRLMPVGKWILFLIAQFPLALSIATSFTYDMVNYALLTLFFSFFCKIYYDETAISWKKMAIMTVIGVVVFPIKYAYLPFCLLIIMIPKKKFNFKYVNIVKSMIIIVCIISTFSDNAIISRMEQTNVIHEQNISDSGGFDVYKLFKSSQSNWKSKDEIIGDKSNLIKYTYNTLYMYLDYYWNGMIGMKIGWGDTFIPDFIYNIWWFLLLFAIIGTGHGRYIDKKNRMRIFTICALSLGAIYMAMLLFATPVDYLECPSVGARYILPLLFPFCVALRGNKISISNKISDELFIWGADICQIIGIVYTFVGYLGR